MTRWGVAAMRQDCNWIAIGYHENGGKIQQKHLKKNNCRRLYDSVAVVTSEDRSPWCTPLFMSWLLVLSTMLK